MNRDKLEEEVRTVLSNVLKNVINKNKNGEITLAEFIEEVEFVVRRGQMLERLVILLGNTERLTK